MSEKKSTSSEDKGQDPVDRFYDQYKNRIKEQLGQDIESSGSEKIISKEYTEFKEQYLPKHLTFYEKACNLCAKILTLKADKKREEQLRESISICHLDITPGGVMSFSFLCPFIFMIFGGALSYFLTSFFFGQPSLFILVIVVMSGLALIIPLQNLPYILANNWRLKASNQMILCVFYIVSFMRHTSNLELAIKFASDHIAPPLSLDLKKVLWNVETEKYESVKEALEEYMASWRRWNLEFVESIHLIEASLYETTEERRIEALEKALSLILEETYEKMLHFAHDLKSPIEMLHMMGIILPVLGLVILPLVASFMDNVRWYHISILYNIILPLAVYYLGKMVLSTRPTGYGETEITHLAPETKKYQNMVINLGKKQIFISPFLVAGFIAAVLVLIGISPLLIHALDPTKQKTFDIILDSRNRLEVINTYEAKKDAKFSLLDYRKGIKVGGILGPYGIGASLLSLFLTLGIGFGLGMYFLLRTKNLMKLRANAKALEEEFGSALFQLGSRIGDGLPAEIAFAKVYQLIPETTSGRFFQLVSLNISKLGMGIEKAIFDKNVGALTKYPSKLIESSMKVFIESARKGPKIASQSLINVSIYLKEIHAVDERLKDLLAEIISSMNSQIHFLAPAISGIVIGITSMITAILGKLGQQISDLGTQTGAMTAGGMSNQLIELFGDSVPTYYFQVIVGIYIVQLVYILSVLVNSIQNGVDRLNERNMVGKNLISATTLYCVIALAVMLIFNMVAGLVLGGLNLM
ncbi:hypothetical protein JW930_03775 [Candidatus Woesearchaeota archaeon]|nr:hypothetical protein [Candidatus Woesearchaeota archaeon]